MKKVTLLVSAVLTIGAYSFAAPQDNMQSTQTEVQTGHIQQEPKANLPGEVKQLVEQVKKAPPSEKYIYMNQLKQKLRELSAEERREVMHEVVKELKSGGREEAFRHVSGKNERAEREVSEDHGAMKGENRGHSEERGSREMEMEMEMEGKHTMERAQERTMEREHEMEERKSDIQERTNFRYTEREEREVEHEFDRQERSGNYGTHNEGGNMNQGEMGNNYESHNEGGNGYMGGNR